MTTQTVTIDAGGASLLGDLVVPDGAAGIVVFAHGSGSSRFSRRNQQVAEFLQGRGLATLLLDLLTSDEERVDNVTRELRFDIELLGLRVSAATQWAAEHFENLPVGLFGASTGAAAALVAAAQRPDLVRAIVSRGGRPDLAGAHLAAVTAPTLLIVGERDPQVLRLNELAAGSMSTSPPIEIVPGATHLFAEPGALERVSEHAAAWFTQHLAGATPA